MHWLEAVLCGSFSSSLASSIEHGVTQLASFLRLGTRLVVTHFIVQA